MRSSTFLESFRRLRPERLPPMTAHRRRALRAYYTFRLVAPFVYSMWLTVAALYFASVVTGDPFRLATLAVMLEAATLVFEVPTGLFADSFSRKWSIVVGYLIWGGGYLLQALTPDYWVVLLSQLVWGLGFTFVSGAPEAWLVDELGQDEALPLLLRGSQIGQVSTALGIVFATVLGTINVALPIAVGGIATILLALLLGLIMPEYGFQPAGREDKTLLALAATLKASLRELKRRDALRSLVFIGLVIGVSVGGYDALYAPHILQNYVIPLFEPVIWFGILFGCVTVLSIPVLELVKRWLQGSRGRQAATILAWFAMGTVLSNLVFVWAGDFYLAAIVYCLGQTLRTVTKPLFMAWINEHTPSEVRATVISMYWQSNALGQILAAPVWGALANLFSLRIALAGASLSLAPVARIYRSRRFKSPALS